MLDEHPTVTPVRLPDGFDLHCTDCLGSDGLPSLPDSSMDAIVTDPPYGLTLDAPDVAAALSDWLVGRPHRPGGSGFMGMDWDAFVPGPEVWRECFRVLKPGGHMLVFASPRTWDLMSVAVRLAGFESRDTIASLSGAPGLAWVHGQGFPKGRDVSSDIDRLAGAERPVVGHVGDPDSRPVDRIALAWGGATGKAKSGLKSSHAVTAPATDAARAWDGWNTALKPAWEAVLAFRKPLSEPNVAENVLRWGTGALNIGACRVTWPGGTPPEIGTPGWGGPRKKLAVLPGQDDRTVGWRPPDPHGRWPTDLVLVHDPGCGSDGCAPGCPVAVLGAQVEPRCSGGTPQGQRSPKSRHIYGWLGDKENPDGIGPDAGPISRFYPQFYWDDDPFVPFLYCPKASRRERNAGCDGLPPDVPQRYGLTAPAEVSGHAPHRHEPQPNHHPTLKPVALMRWLVRLVTPPGGIVLDPFMGSGTTGIACALEGFRFVGMERNPDYVRIAERRIAWWTSVRREALAGRLGAPLRRRESVRAVGQMALLI